MLSDETDTPRLALLSDDEVDQVLRESLRIAVLGIRPVAQRHRAAHYIPAYLAEVGYEIVPVPVGDVVATEILGKPACRSLREIGVVDILSIFRRPEQVPDHLPDILVVRPKVVWFQSGLMHVASAEALVKAGIKVVHDCIGCRRAAIPPAWAPLAGQALQ